MRNPTPQSELKSFEPFNCNYSHRPPRCSSPKVMMIMIIMVIMMMMMMEIIMMIMMIMMVYKCRFHKWLFISGIGDNLGFCDLPMFFGAQDMAFRALSLKGRQLPTWLGNNVFSTQGSKQCRGEKCATLSTILCRGPQWWIAILLPWPNDSRG